MTDIQKHDPAPEREGGSRLKKALGLIDAVNAEDPTTTYDQGISYPKEQLYAERMTERLMKLSPNASEALQLAVRGQHIERWKIPRNRYSQDRVGYLKWRKALMDFHATRVEGLLKKAGFPQSLVERVQALIRKTNLKKDPEAQILEDVICLVFLEYSLADFTRQHPEEKVVHILHKTWTKMSSVGQQAAQTLDLLPEHRALINKALKGDINS